MPGGLRLTIWLLSVFRNLEGRWGLRALDPTISWVYDCCRDVNNYQYHVEVYLRYHIPCLYKKSRRNIWAIT